MNFIINTKILIFIHLFIVLLLFYTINSFGMHQIGGFDHSAMIETAWRLEQGFTPIRDFYCTFPFLFYFGLDLSYKLFGVKWSSIIIINSLFSILFYFIFYYLNNKILNNKILSIIISLSFISITLVYISYWWYSSITSIAILYFGLSFINYHRENSNLSYFILISSILLLSLTKPNQAGILLLFSSFYLIFFSNQKIKMFFAYFIAFIIHIMLLSLYDLNIFDEIKSLLAISGRGIPSYNIMLGQFTEFDRMIIIIQLLFILSSLIFFKIWKIERNDIHIKIIGIFLIITGLYGLGTNYEAKQLEMPIIFLGIVFIYYNSMNVIHSSKFKIWFIGILIMFLIYGFIMGEKRDRVRLIGQYNQNNQSIINENSFFNGLHEGDEFTKLIKDLSRAIEEYKDYTIFLGPRIEYGYTVFKLPSNIFFPSWWHPGTSFPITEKGKIINKFINSDISILIFYKDDMTYYDSEIIAAIKNNFNLIESGNLYIWKRK